MKKLISFIVILCMTVSLLPVFAEESLMTRDQLVENYEAVEAAIKSSRGQYGYASAGDSSTLSWAASYMMESYYHIYEVTKNTKYLKSLGEQFEEALRNLNYDYGETRPGWDAPNYSVKRVTAANSEFNGTLSAENPNSQTGDGWKIKSVSDSSNVKIEATCGVSNSKGLHLTAGGGKAQGILHFFPTYAANAIYQVNFSTKGDAAFRVYLYNNTSSEIIPTLDGREYIPVNVSATSWKTFTLRFRVPDDSSLLSLHFEIPETCESGDIYLDNASFKQAAQFQVHDTMVLATGAKFALAVHRDEKLAAKMFDNKRTYKDVADEFLPMIELLVEKWAPYWREVDEDKGVYVWPKDDSSSYADNTLPHNQYIKMACVMMPLYEITGKSEYLEKSERMLRFFKSKITTVGEGEDAYFRWNYYDPAFSTDYLSASPEDISHGCLELDAAIMGYEYGLVFDESDMKKFANAFVKMLWDGNFENPVLYNNLVDNPAASNYHKAMTSDSNVRDWARLGKWNRDIPVAIVNYMQNHSPKSGHPTKMLAYAYALPYIYNPLIWTYIDGNINNAVQVEGKEKPVTATIYANDGVDEKILEATTWTVTKAGEPFTSDTGKTFTFTLEGKGTYQVVATTLSYTAKATLTVTTISGGGGDEDDEGENEDPEDTPSGDGNGSSGDGNGSSGGGGGSSGGGGGSSGGGGGGGVSSAPSKTPEKEEEKPSDEETKPSPITPQKQFNDVKESDWYHKAVNHSIEKGYMNGVSDTDFNPQGNMTRAMLAKVLHNMEKNPTHNAENKFSDIKDGEWYTEAVLWAAEQGIVTGYGNGNYGANDNITREQLAVMLWRYSDSPKSDCELTFDDAEKISPWALDAMRWAVEKGILNGKSAKILSPETFATRAEVAQMLMNFSESFSE